MAIYKVNADGKAPSGLKAGDTVVTGGGTYKITGVNSDGSYKSQLASTASTTYNYTGGYANAPSGGGSKGSSGGSSGSKTTTTDPYGGRYNSTNGDIGLYGQQLMEQGANWKDVQQAWQDRYAKASTTDGFSQYANDDIQNAMWEYIQNAIREENAQERDQYIEDWGEQFTEEKPTYESKYDPAIDEMLNKILNRDDFSYDVTTDPLYQQYQTMYRQEGDRAMQETLANAAASAGGMNSYAITAAQQAGNYYNSQMNNKIPELYQLAYEMYLQDKAGMVEDLGILQNMDNTQYNRYRDTMNDFHNDKNFAYGVYKDAVGQGNWQQNFDYNQSIGDRNFNYDSTWRDKEWDNSIGQQDLENKRYDDALKHEAELRAKEEAKAQADALLAMGQMPSNELLAAAGYDAAYATAYIAGIKAELARQNSSKTSNSSSDGSKKKKVVEVEDDKPKTPVYTGKDVTQHPQYNNGSVEGLGIGPVNDETLKKIAVKGGLTADANGGIHWADGWNANNWEEKMKFPFSNLATDILMNGLYNL